MCECGWTVSPPLLRTLLLSLASAHRESELSVDELVCVCRLRLVLVVFPFASVPDGYHVNFVCGELSCYFCLLVYDVLHWPIRAHPVVAVSGSGHARKQVSEFDAVIHCRKFRLAGASLLMLLAQHLAALRAWCKQCVPDR